MKNLASKSLFIICLVLALLLFKECQSGKDCSQVYQEPIGLITDTIANQYEEAFKLKESIKNEIIASTNNPVVEDYREVWFDLDELDNYIKYVRKNADTLGLEDLGMRMYFGAKQDASGIVKNTVFFTPTHSEVTRAPQDNPNASRTNTGDVKSLNMGDPGKVEFQYPL